MKGQQGKGEGWTGRGEKHWNVATPGGPHASGDTHLPLLWEAGQTLLNAVAAQYPEHKMAINDAGYIRASGGPQVKHKDLSRHSRAKVRVALTCLVVLTPCPHDGTQGVWVPLSEDGIPYPWVEVPFPVDVGSITAMPFCIIPQRLLPTLTVSGSYM